MEQAPELEQVCWRVLLDKGGSCWQRQSKPAEQMGIAAQLGEVEHLREIGLEIGEEVTGGDCDSVSYSMGSQGGGESLDTGIKNLTEYDGVEAWARCGGLGWSGRSFLGRALRARGGKSSARISPGCRGWPAEAKSRSRRRRTTR